MPGCAGFPLVAGGCFVSSLYPRILLVSDHVLSSSPSNLTLRMPFALGRVARGLFLFGLRSWSPFAVLLLSALGDASVFDPGRHRPVCLHVSVVGGSCFFSESSRCSFGVCVCVEVLHGPFLGGAGWLLCLLTFCLGSAEGPGCGLRGFLDARTRYWYVVGRYGLGRSAPSFRSGVVGPSWFRGVCLGACRG